MVVNGATDYATGVLTSVLVSSVLCFPSSDPLHRDLLPGSMGVFPEWGRSVSGVQFGV